MCGKEHVYLVSGEPTVNSLPKTTAGKCELRAAPSDVGRMLGKNKGPVL